MNLFAWNNGVERLKKNLPRAGEYLTFSRTEMISAKLRMLTDREWELVVDSLILEGRPPTWARIRASAQDFLEAHHKRANAEYDSWTQSLGYPKHDLVPKEEVDQFFDMLRRRSAGEISHEEFGEYCRILQRTAELNLKGAFECLNCTDTGILELLKDGYTCVARCACATGSKRKEAIPMYDNTTHAAYEIVKRYPAVS